MDEGLAKQVGLIIPTFGPNWEGERFVPPDDPEFDDILEAALEDPNWARVPE